MKNKTNEFKYFEITGSIKILDGDNNDYFIATVKALTPSNHYIVNMCNGNILFNLRVDKNGKIKSMDRAYE